MASYVIGHLEQIRALAATGRTLAIGGTRLDGVSAVTLFDAGTRKVLRQVAVPTHANALGLTGEKLFVGGADGKLHRFAVATGESAGAVEAHAGGVTAIAVSGTHVATAGVDGRVVVWSACPLRRATSPRPPVIIWNGTSSMPPTTPPSNA